MKFTSNQSIVVNIDDNVTSVTVSDTSVDIYTSDANLNIRFETEEELKNFVSMLVLALRSRDKGGYYSGSGYRHNLSQMNFDEEILNHMPAPLGEDMPF